MSTTQPHRTCIGCRRVRPQGELLRVARTPAGVRFDPHLRLPGRGAYVCAERRCIEEVARRDGQPLRRALRGATHDEVTAAVTALEAILGDRDEKAAATPQRSFST